MRPGVALTPGERYIVAVRGLVDGGGQPVEPEAPFAALRDDRFSDIDAVAARRPYFEAEIFPQLALAGVARNDLILAFDFTVRSDAGLTAQVLSMRSQAMTWLAGQAQPTFTVGSVETNDCLLPGVDTWKIVRGTYQVPNYLTADPEGIFNLGVLNLDVDGVPVQNGVTNPPYTISIPCSVNDAEPPVAHPVVLGHGLFGEGEGMVTGLSALFSPLGYITGATNFRGLSNADFAWVGTQIVGLGNSMLNNFGAFADRLKQGQINTQLLARMMKDGLFNGDAAFQDNGAQGVFPGSTEDQYYLGISLGGVMGTFFAALTDDVERFNLDVPAINFGFLLQRSTQFSTFDTLLTNIGLSDPMDAILGLDIIHELWVTGEPAGFVHHLAPEVASGDKRLLITVAWLDKQVSNQATEIMARTLGVPNLTASVLQGMEGIPDVAGPQNSAMVIYDTGSFDIFDPLHVPLFPPLANIIPSSVCDPHGARPVIPVSISQVTNFLQPGGQVVNFCVGVCDGIQAEGETANGAPACDPLAP